MSRRRIREPLARQEKQRLRFSLTPTGLERMTDKLWAEFCERRAKRNRKKLKEETPIGEEEETTDNQMQ
jgi:hypothetical protein